MDWDGCLCCQAWERFAGSGEPSCPSCGHTVEECDAGENLGDSEHPRPMLGTGAPMRQFR